jgi:hypothetical protein
VLDVLYIDSQSTTIPSRTTEYELGPGDLFYVAPGHDSWVIGEAPYVSLHFLGATDYAKRS